MMKIDISKQTKIVIVAVVILALAPFVIYLKVLPAVVSNGHVISFVERTLHEIAGLEFSIKNSVLKTGIVNRSYFPDNMRYL